MPAGKEDAEKPFATRMVEGFVHRIVHSPCCVIVSALTISIVFSIVGVAAVTGSGQDLFSSASPPDINHITSINADAYAMAYTAVGAAEEDEGVNEHVPQQSIQGHVLFIMYDSGADGSTVLTASNLATMKEVNDRIVDNAKFSDFCLRRDNSTECRAPLTPINVFWSSTTITDDIIDYNVADMADFSDIAADFEANMHVSGNPFQAVADTKEMPKWAGRESDVDDVAGVVMQMIQIGATFDGKGETMSDVDATVKLLRAMTKAPTPSQMISYYFDRQLKETGAPRFARAMTFFGTPLEGYDNREDREAEQDAKITEWMQDNFRSYLQGLSSGGDGFDVLYFATPLLGDEFLLIIVVDLSLAVGSMIVVFLYLWYQTGSLVVAIGAITEILFSLPLAFFVYRVILGFEYMSGLCAMGLYIILAIGADDVFVFMDAFKQSLYQGSDVLQSFESRMLWTYRRAAGAMAITSFTTMCAFAATALSPLAEVQSFGIFAALLILADYILVITFMPAVVTYWHNHLESRPALCCACCHSDGCSGLCKTQETTATQRRIADLKAHATSGAGDAEDGVGGIKVGTLTGDDGIELPEVSTTDASTTDASTAPRGDELAKTASSAGPKVEKRKLEHFFEGPFADFVTGPKSRYAIIAFFALLLIPVIILDLQAEEAKSPDQFFPSDHPFQRIFDAFTAFPASTEDRNTEVVIYWGVSTVDRAGVVPLVDPSNKGALVWDSTFTFDEETQNYLVSACDRARGADFMARDPAAPIIAEVHCPMDDFKTYRELNDLSFPVPLAQAGTAVEEFLSAPVINSTQPGQTYFGLWSRYMGVVDGEVVFVAMSSFAQLAGRAFSSKNQIEVHYVQFEAFKDDINAEAPTTANKALQTALADPPKWVWMHTQGIYVQSAVTGASFGAGLAFVVLLAATQNIVVAFLAVITIIGILGSVLATMVVMGWTLGNIVSINLTILGGFAVDYVVHLSHSYMHSKSTTREERVRDALRDMGVSVISGMITSVGASTMLFFTTLQFFSKFGGFLCMTVLWAWLWANLFFLSMLTLAGPVGGETMLGLKAAPPAKRKALG